MATAFVGWAGVLDVRLISKAQRLLGKANAQRLKKKHTNSHAGTLIGVCLWKAWNRTVVLWLPLEVLTSNCTAVENTVRVLVRFL